MVSPSSPTVARNVPFELQGMRPWISIRPSRRTFRASGAGARSSWGMRDLKGPWGCRTSGQGGRPALEEGARCAASGLRPGPGVIARRPMAPSCPGRRRPPRARARSGRRRCRRRAACPDDPVGLAPARCSVTSPGRPGRRRVSGGRPASPASSSPNAPTCCFSSFKRARSGRPGGPGGRRSAARATPTVPTGTRVGESITNDSAHDGRSSLSVPVELTASTVGPVGP